MSRDFAEVLEDIETRVAALSGWTAVDVAYDLFGPDAVPDAVPARTGHLAFVVGAPASAGIPTVDGRQRVTGQHALTDVGVKFLARLQAKAQRTSIRAGFTAELALINQLINRSASWPVNFSTPTWVRSSRSSNPSGAWRLHEVTFSVVHLIDNA